ncbi:putative protease Do [Trifolium repens]|nr:putative protease Do [Trifolium repens]
MENRSREKLIYRSDETLKKFLPTYLSSMEKHYESPAPAVQDIWKLSPRDLHRTWEEASYNDDRLKSAIRELAPSVVSVSYFTGFQRKVDCSGFIIDWDDSKGIATLLTSAKLTRSPSKRGNYYIIVRLANGKMLLAEEDYVDYYHNIVTFKVNSDAKLRPLNLSPPLPIQQDIEVVALARNFCTCKLSESCGLLRGDYPYFGCEQLLSSTCSSGQAGEGGPLITKAGQIIGINFFDGHRYVHPLPTSVIRLCLENWKSHGIVMQPWLGFTAIDISNLPFDTYEFNYDSSLVVKEVYKGSPADKVGVRSGDSINAVNGWELSSVGLQKYSELLNEASDKLSACRPNQTDRMVFVRVNGNKLVHAENLSVNHKNFCSCWLGGESDWTYMMPLTGSQTRRAYDIGYNVNFSLEPLGVVTDAGSDTANDDVIPMYSER